MVHYLGIEGELCCPACSKNDCKNHKDATWVRDKRVFGLQVKVICACANHDHGKKRQE